MTSEEKRKKLAHVSDTAYERLCTRYIFINMLAFLNESDQSELAKLIRDLKYSQYLLLTVLHISNIISRTERAWNT